MILLRSLQLLLLSKFHKMNAFRVNCSHGSKSNPCWLQAGTPTNPLQSNQSSNKPATTPAEQDLQQVGGGEFYSICAEAVMSSLLWPAVLMMCPATLWPQWAAAGVWLHNTHTVSPTMPLLQPHYGGCEGGKMKLGMCEQQGGDVR